MKRRLSRRWWVKRKGDRSIFVEWWIRPVRKFRPNSKWAPAVPQQARSLIGHLLRDSTPSASSRHPSARSSAMSKQFQFKLVLLGVSPRVFPT